MNGFRFLQTSDLHLDWLFEKFPPEKRKKRREELLDTYDQIIELAIKEKVEAVLIAGDLFHSPTPNYTTLAHVEKGFIQLKNAGIKVLIIPGNHDLYKEGSCYRYYTFPDNVYIFGSEEFTAYQVKEDVTVYGLPYHEKWAGERALLTLKLAEHSGVHVGMIHGTYKGVPVGEEEYSPVVPGDINRSGLNHLAMGHYHNYRDCSQRRTTACYAGSPARLSFNNLEDRIVLIVETAPDKKTVWEQKVLPSRPYRMEEYNLSEKSFGQILAELSNRVNAEECLKLVFKGIIEEDQLCEMEAMEANLQKKCFYVEVDDQLMIMPAESEPDTVKGLFVKKMKALMQKKDITPEEMRLYQEALRVGLTVLKGGHL